MSKCRILLPCIWLSVKCGTVHVRYVHLHGKLIIHDPTSVAIKMQGQFHCNGYMYDDLLFWDFDTITYNVQLDNNYSAL